MSIEFDRQVIGNGIFREVLKGKLMTQAVGLKLPFHAFKRMVA